MIANRIQLLIDTYCEGNKTVFAKAVGVTLSAITNITGARKGAPSFDVLNKIVTAYPFISANWLITGRGEMELKEPDVNTLKRIIEAQNEIIALQKDNAELKSVIQKLTAEKGKSGTKETIKREQ